MIWGRAENWGMGFLGDSSCLRSSVISSLTDLREVAYRDVPSLGGGTRDAARSDHMAEATLMSEI